MDTCSIGAPIIYGSLFILIQFLAFAIASACALCCLMFNSSNDNNYAVILISIIMNAMPLLLIGLSAYYSTVCDNGPGRVIWIILCVCTALYCAGMVRDYLRERQKEYK